MESLSRALVGEFIDAVVQEPNKATDLLAKHPSRSTGREASRRP
jgi:hypothetical protein